MFTLLVVSWLLVGPLNANEASQQSSIKASVAEEAIDIRGIWKDRGLDVKKARARGLNPDLIETPVKILNVPPTYPATAQLARQQGVVRLECRIETDGGVGSCVVIRRLAPVLDAEALATVIQWRYRPLTVNGVPKPALAVLTVAFSLG